MTERLTVEARTGKAVRVGAGQRLKVINTHGTQVVDTWAIGAEDPAEYMSMEQTRRMNFRIHPRVGDALYSNRRDPFVWLEEDSGAARHDTLIAACDEWVYLKAGRAAGHPSCQGNFRKALSELDIAWSGIVPNPLNLWMNIPVHDNETITMEAPVSRAGDHVVFAPAKDVVMVFSACPADMTDINGKDRVIRDVELELVG